MKNLENESLDMFKVSDKVKSLAINSQLKLKQVFNKIDEIALYNQAKVMKAFKDNKISDTHFKASTGYGYDDLGREAIERLYADIFKAEDALVRIQFVNGTHALSTALFANLVSGDILLSITGDPYDSLAETIGTKENELSLMSMGVKYDQIELKNDEFDIDEINKYLKENKTKMIFIGRSRGYSTRRSQDIKSIENVIEHIREVDDSVIIMVDNCYGEFVEIKEPIEVGADIIAGSLIKNIGGGLCEMGGYIVGKKKYVERASMKLTAPGIGKECGATLGKNKEILQGLYIAPMIVKNALKIAVFTSKMLEDLGYEVSPKFMEDRTDIIQSITLYDKDKLISFIQGIQSISPIDSFVLPQPWEMPGYDLPVIMAAGTFVSGSSIELSADAPIKEPYIAYIQGGITYESAKIGICVAIDKMIRGNE